jgi:hypothetical protein
VHTSQLVTLGAGNLYRCGKTSIMNYLLCSALRKTTLHFYLSASNITSRSQTPIALVYITLSTTIMSVEAAAAILFGTLQISISLVTLWQQYRVQRDRQRNFSHHVVLVKA